MKDLNATMFKGETDITGDPFQIIYNFDQNYIFISEDAGPMTAADYVTIERRNINGDYISYGATIYNNADAWTVDYPAGSWCRIVIKSAVPLTVEFTG